LNYICSDTNELVNLLTLGFNKEYKAYFNHLLKSLNREIIIDDNPNLEHVKDEDKLNITNTSIYIINDINCFVKTLNKNFSVNEGPQK
jgi:hypothetical protein